MNEEDGFLYFENPVVLVVSDLGSYNVLTTKESRRPNLPNGLPDEEADRRELVVAVGETVYGSTHMEDPVPFTRVGSH